MTSTTRADADGGVGVLSPQRRALDGTLLAGLAGVFLVNAVVAVLQPSDFTGLIERSLAGRSVPLLAGGWMTWAIAANDFVLGLCLTVSMWSRRARNAVLAWAGLWLLAVTVIKLTSLKALGG
jgi:hypothetical protein